MHTAVSHFRQPKRRSCHNRALKCQKLNVSSAFPELHTISFLPLTANPTQYTNTFVVLYKHLNSCQTL